MKCILITGVAGGIGQTLASRFTEAGYAVIGTDLATPPKTSSCEHFIQADLGRTVADESYAADIFVSIRKALSGRPLAALINNAAMQILGTVETLDRNAWRTTLDVNLLAPFFWTKEFLPELEEARGVALNISSIHARLTKPEFTAYATSKAALSGMTRAMAVELGSRIRVIAIEPAAIETPMLRAGFMDNQDGYERLEKYHPTETIGTPRELADLANALVSMREGFLNGSVISIDGGIGARLHDPE